MKFTAATWNCQGCPIGTSTEKKEEKEKEEEEEEDKEILLNHLLGTTQIIMLQETGNPTKWGLKDGVPGIFRENWHALFCIDPAAFNSRCSVGLLIHKDIPVTKMGFVTSTYTYRPLVHASIGSGVVGSFHAVSSKAAGWDWKKTRDQMLEEMKPSWRVVGGDFNDDMIQLFEADSDSDDEHIGAIGAITQKSGGSIDGFKWGGNTNLVSSLYKIPSPRHSGARYSFSSDHQALGANFQVLKVLKG